MSIIDVNSKLYREKELVNNYAAEYAKRECDKVLDEAAAHKSASVLDHPDGSVTTAKLADEAVTEEKIADCAITAEKLSDELMETIDIALSTAEDANLNAIAAAEAANAAATASQTSAENANAAAASAKASAEAAESAANEEIVLDRLADEVKEEFTLKPASADTLGGIKPLYKSVNGTATNRSGLIIADDGTTYVTTANGIKLSGSGQVIISAASEEEVFAGTEPYKPITPARFSQFITYSTTPQRVGTWIDGTPIWRMAIDRELTDSEKSSFMFDIDDDILTNVTVDFGESYFILINSFMSITANNSACGALDNANYDPFTFTFTDYTENSAVTILLPENCKLTGWIEFATPEENLII